MSPLPISAEPATAHGKLAAAVGVFLAAEEPDQMLAGAEALARALDAYRIAEMAAVSAPFGRILDQAITQCEAGDAAQALKCLQTLRMLGDFTPLVDVDKIRPPA